MRLIDADAFERHVYTEWVNGELSNSEWVDFRHWLRDEPTIDAVPVVRCKDCFNQPGCQFAQYQGNRGYCSLGERRES